ncbi:hypothetical protein [Microbacterium sp. RG1]|uniref:hypothetical protein n=1 Tax=Microbacterium sp. RG1 TaxID=2489212 RepID=UPI0010CA5C06|nr:hypothetical protein [Microbacterium sp. RG1]QCQ16979.1 hypothetical protein EHF32_09755 [Microbacterium sp. RG1]
MTTETPTTRRTTELLALWVIAGVALVVGVILALTAGASADSFNSADDVVIVAALSWWSNALLLVGVIMAAGALVLSGVRSLLRRSGLPV